MVGPVNPYVSNIYPPLNDDSHPLQDGVKQNDPYDLDLEIHNPPNQPPAREMTYSQPCQVRQTQQCNTAICSQHCTNTCNGGPGCP